MSNFWKEVNKEIDIFQTGINKSIKNGSNTLFWYDRWLSDCSLKLHYPMLFESTTNTNDTMAQVIEYNRFYIHFNRLLNATLSQQSHTLYNTLSTIHLNTI
jgi:hypothetical protein